MKLMLQEYVVSPDAAAGGGGGEVHGAAQASIDELRAEIAQEEGNYARLREELSENRKALQGLQARATRVPPVTTRAAALCPVPACGAHAAIPAADILHARAPRTSRSRASR